MGEQNFMWGNVKTKARNHLERLGVAGKTFWNEPLCLRTEQVAGSCKYDNETL